MIHDSNSLGPNSDRMDLSRAIRDRLKEAGWDEVSLAGISDLPWEDIKGALSPVTGTMNFAQELELKTAITAAKDAQERQNRAFASQPFAWFSDMAWRRRYGPEAETPLLPLVKWEAVRSQAPVARWPTKFQRKLQELEDGDSREKLEDAERNRVVQALADVLTRTRLWKPDDSRPHARQASMRIAMGRRLGTLRQHLRNLSKMHQFCLASFGAPWFTCPQDLYDLLVARLSEPCARYLPRSLVNTIGFAEKAAEIPEADRLSRHPGVQNFLREIESSRGWRTGKVVRKAQPFMVMLVLSLEQMVMSPNEARYPRWYAWIKLVKLWGALRWSDLQGVPHEGIELRKDGSLIGRILRSKTSGQGRRVEVVHFFVDSKAFLIHRDWLLTGWKLNADMTDESGMGARDYLVPKPTPNLQSFRKSMVKYQDALSMSRGLLALLPLDVDPSEVDRPEGSGTPLLKKGALGFWSEHSERGTMTTYMQLAKVPGEVRKMVGRWAMTQDEEYLRNLESSVRAAQVTVARMLSTWSEPRLQDFECQIANDLVAYLRHRKVDEEEIREQVSNLSLPETKKVPKEQDDPGDGTSGFRKKEREEEVETISNTTIFTPSPGVLAKEEDSATDEEGSFDQQAMQVENAAYVFSIVGSCRRRTLHRVGECWRVPGVNYKDFLVAGEERPPLLSGDRECRDCFRRNLSIPGQDEDEVLQDTSSSSSEEETSTP